MSMFNAVSAAASTRLLSWRRLAGGVAALALSLAACGVSHADPVRLKVAEVIRSQFYLPFYLALGKGFTQDEGLDVELVTANGGDKVGSLVLTGGADIGLAGPEVPIYIYNSESTDKPVIISALTGTDGFFLASRKKIDGFKWSMIDGKILAYREGSTPLLFLQHVLKKNGVKPEVIKNGLVTNIGVTARDGAWISGQGDFGIFMEPNLSKLEKQGQLHVIASIGKEAGRADYTVFFAKKSWVEKNRATAQMWVNAIGRAQAWMHGASSNDIAAVIAPFFPGISPEDTVALVDRYRNSGAPIWSDTPLVDRAGLGVTQQIMIEGGTLPADKVVSYDTIVDASFADAAIKKMQGR